MKSLKKIAGGIAMALFLGSFPSAPVAAAPAGGPPIDARALSADRRLALYSLNSRKTIEVDYCQDGYYDPEALSVVDRLLRDPVSGDVRGIDPKLLDLLYELHERVGGTAPFTVFCGYRSPKTNASLREFNKAVAERSLHMQGKAVDISLPGTPLALLHKTALGMKAGGVGYYPRSGFIHVDVGPVRSW
jgi:uncharacterized protein YcbK (DUF882 family)